MYCWGNNNPRGIIEVKNRVYNIRQYEEDIERIKSILERNRLNSSLQFDIFTFYTAASKKSSRTSAKGKINRRLDSIMERVKNILGDGFTSEVHIQIHVNKDTAWCATRILIRKTNRH